MRPDTSERPIIDIAHANREARMVQGSCVAEVLRKTGARGARRAAAHGRPHACLWGAPRAGLAASAWRMQPRHPHEHRLQRLPWQHAAACSRGPRPRGPALVACACRSCYRRCRPSPNPLAPGLEPTQIDILVTNCSIYCPVPSMTSMLINMFGMREDVQAYHLGGMGCSMGVVGLNLVRDLLAVSGGPAAAGPAWRGGGLACRRKSAASSGRPREGAARRWCTSLIALARPPPPPPAHQAHPNKIALFVTNEVVTAGFYLGDRKEALVTNALFRMGGAAAVLTNR
jgi:hypothetical protein